MINQIFMPSLASGACTMSDRGSPIAVPGVAAGGYNNNSHKQHRASTLIKAGRLALTISQWLLQIELIFRLLLKITVEEPHACDLTYLCPPRGGTIQKSNPLSGSYFYSICQKGSVTRVWPRSGHVDRSGLQLWYIAPERRQEHVYLGVLAVTGRLEAGH